MKQQDLVLNLVPTEIGNKTIYTRSTDAVGGAQLLGLTSAQSEKAWAFAPFENSTPLVVRPDQTPIMKRLICRSLRDFFAELGLIVSEDFIGRIVILKFIQNSAQRETQVYKKYALRPFAPGDQHACKGQSWHLNISYMGETEVTTATLATMPALRTSASRVIAGQTMRKIERLTPDEALHNVRAVVSYDVRKLLGYAPNYVRVANKYSRQYDESYEFYKNYLFGKTVHDFVTVFESGFQSINEGQVRKATKDSNLLLFGNNHTNFNPYNGLKEYGPYQPVSGDYRFFFVFHKEDAAYANRLYSCLTKGLKGFPGLYRFVGLQLALEREKTITFVNDNPVNEIQEAISGYTFDQNTRYMAIYISRVKKDDVDEEKRLIYYRLKKVFLESNVSSQVVYRDNISLDNFNYFLPNISIAILAKLGGIPWRLSRPVRHDLIVGLGAFRETPTSLILGTTVAFKNDGTFLKFDSHQVASVGDLISFFQSILASVAHSQPEIKRLVVHFYKQMNHEEEGAVSAALQLLNLRIPYIVATINEEDALIPFDAGYSGKMPTRGTCIVLKRGDYLLCNNTRYADVTGSRIEDFPFPVRIKISRTSLADLSDEDVQQIIDQVYQFSRMYWVSVKQKGKPVTVLYSERVAAISAAFENRQLPRTDTATKSLWFL